MRWDDDTPPESPKAKKLMTDPNTALQAVLENIERRLNVLDQGQLFLYATSTEEEPTGVQRERAQLEDTTRRAITRWKGTWESSSDGESDRPSQSNIIVNIENARPAEKSNFPSLTIGSAKFRRFIILIAILVSGTVIGVFWALKLLHVIHSRKEPPATSVQQVAQNPLPSLSVTPLAV
jgi:hypothetical protein